MAAWQASMPTIAELAAAILGDANKVNFVSLTAAERFAVQTGDVDLLMRTPLTKP